MDGWTDACMNGQMDGCMHGWTDGQMHAWISIRILIDQSMRCESWLQSMRVVVAEYAHRCQYINSISISISISISDAAIDRCERDVSLYDLARESESSDMVLPCYVRRYSYVQYVHRHKHTYQQWPSSHARRENSGKGRERECPFCRFFAASFTPLQHNAIKLPRVYARRMF